MDKQAVNEISTPAEHRAIMLDQWSVLAAVLALGFFGGRGYSDEIPGEVFLNPVAPQTVRSLYEQRDDTLSSKTELLARFYAEILPDRFAKQTNVDNARRTLAEKKRSNRGNLFEADVTVQAAVEALAYAELELANDYDYTRDAPLVAETRTRIEKIYLALRECVPKSPNDPLLDAITAAFESGCDSPYSPIEAHILSAMSASFAGRRDSALKHLHVIQSEQLFSKWPEWPGLTGDFCVTCTLLDSAEICKTQQKRLEGWKTESDDPHVLWSIAMCRALSKKGSADIYFRRAVVADNKRDIPASLMESIMWDCLAYTAFSRQTLPKRLKELARSQALQGSGLSQALFARAALAESQAQREQLLQEGLRRCPPDAREIILASFRLAGEPTEGGGVKEPKAPVGLD
jgi:hypothetical protein